MTKEAEEIQVLGKAELIKVDKVPEAITVMLSNHRNIIGDLEAVLPSVKNPEVKKFMEKRLHDSKKTIQALEKGFVPVLMESPINLQVKSGFLKAELEEIMKTIPPEAKAALGRARLLGMFDQFVVSGGPRGGDPIIAGVIRNKYFLISAWVNVDGGGAVGYIFKPRS